MDNRVKVYDADTSELLYAEPNMMDRIVNILDKARMLLPTSQPRYYPIGVPSYYSQGENFKPSLSQQIHDFFNPRQPYMDYARPQEQQKEYINPNYLKAIENMTTSERLQFDKNLRGY